MIKINLLQQKQTKPISIPFGWIFVAAYAVAACVVLYMINAQRLGKLEELTNELEEIKTRVKQVKQYTEQAKAKERQKDILQRNKAAYEKILTPGASGGGWTGPLLAFEKVVKEAKSVWMRDLRVEGDGRVQLNGISRANKKTKKHQVRGITKLLNAMNSKETQFRSVRLKRLNWEPFKTEQVVSFEIQCLLTR